ncbi:DUF2169 domain-containing protein [Caballeronia sp. LZ034LL]|uniref:DUF2169 family type VI secretion system accessory protein n=1 Tax=Caballeronia sp. LZ034LL TaxID=3038567 RepID=UPI00285AF4C2|nr:DUF2169 domain-containing protein [Caballeronia sp. LZ034LL]MDR5837109.1 DUF2169 domain-containing protein [Caballeronia sp. LZ034LL]
MKIIKPDTCALLFRTLRFEGRDLLSIGAMAMFPLTPPAAGPAPLASEADLWTAGAAALGDGGLLDAGFPKPRGEWLAYGAAHAPGGAPAALVETVVQVGNSRKALYVYGDRSFGALGGISAAEPFQRMPVDPARAYGGPAFAPNPAGRGARPQAGDGARQPLPNVERPDALVAMPGDEREPAGYWALPATSPQRAALLGPFDDRWLAQQWPHLPAQTHTEYFCCAPADQRIDGFWRGDEAIAVDHMHPEQPLLRGRLPGLRARCFVSRRAGAELRFEEFAARPETVWVFPEIGQGIVLFRAVATLTDEDADDIAHIVTGFEPMGESPLPVGHYRDKLFAAPVPAVPAKPQAAPAVATPSAPSVQPFAMPAPAGAPPGELSQIDQVTSEIDALKQDLLKQHGLSQQEAEALAQQAMPPAATPPGGLQQELDAMLQSLESSTADLLKQHNLTQDDVQRYIASPQPAAAANPGAAQGANGFAALAAEVRQAHAQTREALAASGTSLEQLAASTSDPRTAAALREAASLDIDALLTNLEALGSLPAAAPAVPQALQTALAPAPAQAAPLTRDAALARLATGGSLAGLDLSGVDLAGADLQGVDFGGALLTGARLTGSRLAGANFRRALLTRADFAGADLRGATLASASARGANFSGTRLDEASLEAGDFASADFSAANLERARMAKAVFNGATMTGLVARGCIAPKAGFAECELTGADFSDASLEHAVFDHATLGGASFVNARCAGLRLFGVRAAGVRFERADLGGSRAGLDSDLSGARFDAAHLHRAVWIGVDISQSVFDGATLEHANFSGVQASGTRFTGVRAASIQLAKADLSGADLSRANLMHATLRRATVDRANFASSNLYGAQCYGANLGHAASFEGANVDRTLISIPGRAELDS